MEDSPVHAIICCNIQSGYTHAPSVRATPAYRSVKDQTLSPLMEDSPVHAIEVCRSHPPVALSFHGRAVTYQRRSAVVYLALDNA